MTNAYAHVELLVTDFDGDNFIGRHDLKQTLSRLSRDELSDEEAAFIVDKVGTRPTVHN